MCERGPVEDIAVGREVPANSARLILLASTFRSGSSFLGDLLSRGPGTFYYFEPLHYHATTKDKAEIRQNEEKHIFQPFNSNN